MTNTVTTMMEPATKEGATAGILLLAEQEISTKGAKSQKKWLTRFGPQKSKK